MGLLPIMERKRRQSPGRTANQQHLIVSEDGSAGRDWAAALAGDQRDSAPFVASGGLMVTSVNGLDRARERHMYLYLASSPGTAFSPLLTPARN